ncbi:MAG: Translation initiation factor IF-3 [Microgenomates group bacterium GW2011_GWC1_37_8]|uniref:Translation initiation factor IF-3 n=2 Tax=Candidatus Woeseibacteriota TaxID=1752722 RepID=A0A0G0P967_9BACT|nr:MAG: Translation initiation factor IF-3 [Microgenomates group bacterium GW2011_GWC1_37_8]KKQ85871.1 MAG: Translation initiation factor IF-3 [Candidatus Woesebacteria bacterium GW2011_GWB1_38_8]OGM21999.1 MAG: translation initiation factor IF-3 [Candidatus Woesebacteria bacterium RIFCSPHIGHO2_01_FULL_38_9b]
MITGKFNWRINNQIQAQEVRVIGPDKKQVGVMKLNEALAKANEAGLDLVEIAPTAKPPVVQIVELGKFKYEQEKRLRQEKKKTKASELKEIRFSPFIAQHDYQTRMVKIKEFLDESNKVRLVVVFKGRHMGSKQFGYDLLKKITSELGARIAVDMQPKFLGRHLVMGISPVKKSIRVKEPESVRNETQNMPD